MVWCPTWSENLGRTLINIYYRLKQREAELAEREIDLLQRELNVMILQQQGPNAPTPKKRKGNFKKSRLKLLKNKDVNQSSTSMISAPLGKTTL